MADKGQPRAIVTRRHFFFDQGFYHVPGSVIIVALLLFEIEDAFSWYPLATQSDTELCPDDP